MLENARGAPAEEQAADVGGTAPAPSDNLPVPARPNRASGHGEQIVLREIAPGDDASEQRTEISLVAASLLEAFQQPAPGADDSTDRLQPIVAREQHDQGAFTADNVTERTNTLDDSGPLAPPTPTADETDVADPSEPTVEITGRFANLPTVPLEPVDPVGDRNTDAATVGRASAATVDDATFTAAAPTPSTSDAHAPQQTDRTADIDDTTDIGDDAGTAYVASVDHTADTDHTTDIPQFLGVDDTGDIGLPTDTADATTTADRTTGTVDAATTADGTTDTEEAPAWDDRGAAEPGGTWNDGIDSTTDEAWDTATASVDAGTVPESGTANMPPLDGPGTPDTDTVAPDDTTTSGDVTGDTVTTTGDITIDPDPVTPDDGIDGRRDVADVDDRSSPDGLSTTDGADRPHDAGHLNHAASASPTAFAVADAAAGTDAQHHDPQSPGADDVPAHEDAVTTPHLPDTVGGATAGTTGASEQHPPGQAGAWTTVAQVMLVIVGVLCVVQIVVLIVVYRFLGEAGADPTDILAAHTKVTAVMLPALMGGTFAATAFAAWQASSTPTQGLHVLGLPVALWAVLISATLVAAVVLLGGSTTILQARQTTLWATAACALLGTACIAAPRAFTEMVDEHEPATPDTRVRV
ncbi:MAG TPA: hypothetical protein VFZ70_09885 [Euzebyales bacterium]